MLVTRFNFDNFAKMLVTRINFAEIMRSVSHVMYQNTDVTGDQKKLFLLTTSTRLTPMCYTRKFR